ncbi:MAG: hypothetical protein KY469_08200 [Actinobacteria bacterium]|nr:hypothetical protein [Actinomycetota bacterium]
MPGADLRRPVTLAVVLVFAIAATSLIAIGAPLEWDETVYALRGRGLLADFPQTGWGLHRPPGLPLLSAPLTVTGVAAAVRVVGLLGGVALLLVVAGFTATVTNSSPWRGRAAALAAALVAASPSVLVRSSQLLTDVPAAALLLAGAWVLWRELEVRATPGWGLLAAPLLLTSAFVVRYGALVYILVTVATAAALWWRRLVGAPAVTAAAAALGLVGFGAHLLWSRARTGEALGVLRLADQLAPPSVPGETLATYLGWIPWTLAGIAGLVAVLVGAAAAVSWIGWAGGARRRLALFLLVPAVGGAVLVAFASGPDPRFLIHTVTLLSIATAVAFAEATSGRRVVAVAVALLVVGAAGTGYLQARHRVIVVAQDRTAIVAAAEAVAADADDEPCGVLAWPVPIVTWYSGCTTEHFGAPPAPDRQDVLPAGRRYLLLVEGGRDQPQGALLSSYLEASEHLTLVEVGEHRVEVRRFH